MVKYQWDIFVRFFHGFMDLLIQGCVLIMGKIEE